MNQTAKILTTPRTTKKRIGIIHYTLPPAISGVEMVIRDHSRILSNFGYKIFLLGATGKKFRSEISVQLARSFDPKKQAVIDIQNDLKKGIVTSHFTTLKQRYFKIIRRWIDENKLEIVIIHNVLSRHYNLALTAAIIDIGERYKDKVKCINWVHDASFLDMAYTKVEKDLIHTYPWNLISEYQPNFMYVTISHTRKKELLGLYGRKKDIMVIPNGLDINKMLPLPLQTRILFKEVLDRKPDYIGLIPVRIAERKNIEYAIEFARIAKEKYNTNFVFLVTGALHLQNTESMKYHEFLKAEIVKHNMQNNIVFLYNYKFGTGEKFDIYKLNIRDLYLIADFLFLPSKGEGFGLPIIEAGFMRIPIFVSQLPVFKEVGNGYINVFDLGDSIDKNIELIINYLKKNRQTLFHKIILKQYSLEDTVKNQIVQLLY